MTALTFDEITKDRPEKSLTEPKKRTGGRNNRGRITVRFIGRRPQAPLPRGGLPPRQARASRPRSRPSSTTPTARPAWRCCTTPTARSATSSAPEGLKVGQTVVAGDGADILPGNCLPLKAIPAGTMIHNIELRHGKGGQMVRSAGGAAQLVAKEGDYAQVKLPSGEVRKVHVDCLATIGQVGNIDHKNVSLGKAGRKRWLGRRPHNRGVVHEPGRPSARRRRGQDLGRPPPGDALGQAHQGRQDPQQQAHAVVHRQEAEVAMARSLKKGPFVDDHLLKKVEADERGQRPQGREDLVAPLHDHPGDGRAHPGRLQRAEVHPRLHHREHGGPQARASSRPPASSRATPRKVEKVAKVGGGPAARKAASKGTCRCSKCTPPPSTCAPRPRRPGWCWTSSAARRRRRPSPSCASPRSRWRATSRRPCAPPSPTRCTWRTRTRSGASTRTTSW